MQLRDLGMADRIDEVLAEIPVVREALGWPPLVTPISQIIGSQAMLNVKFGRWKNFSPAAMDIALGNFGKTPGVVNFEVQKLAEKNTGESVRTGRPGENLPPAVEKLRTELSEKGLPANDEIVSLYAMFPRETEALFKREKNPAAKDSPPAQIPASPPATAQGEPSQARPTDSPAHMAEASGIKRFVISINGNRGEYFVEEVEAER